MARPDCWRCRVLCSAYGLTAPVGRRSLSRRFASRTARLVGSQVFATHGFAVCSRVQKTVLMVRGTSSLAIRFRGRKRPRSLRTQTLTILRDSLRSSRWLPGLPPSATNAGDLAGTHSQQAARCPHAPLRLRQGLSRCRSRGNWAIQWNRLLPLADYGESRCRSRGKSTASRMFSSPSSVITSRSPPSPKPACGGMPYLNIFV